jgi:hypothetical protein
VTIDQDRFPQRGGVHESPDYDTAEHKLDINIETGVASVAVN